MNNRLVEWHSLVIQNSNGLKVICSFEKSGITLKTNQPNCITISVNKEVLIGFLTGFSQLCLSPLCPSSFITVRVKTFAEFYAENEFPLENQQELRITLRELFP